MIKEEAITIEGREFVRHYSDANKYIKQVETGAEYSEAVDVIPCQYTYLETDREIEKTEETL